MLVKVLDTIRSCRTEDQLEYAEAWASRLGLSRDDMREVDIAVAGKAGELAYEMEAYERAAESIRIAELIGEIPW